jgi:uncharacterized protein (TIGR03382 family)
MSAHRRARRPGVSRMAAGLALLTGVAVGLGAARPALAFVRYKTPSGALFFWPQTCVPVTAYPDSLTAVNGNMELSSPQIMTAATMAAAAWGADMNACTFLHINVSQQSGAAPPARLDYKNSLVFRTDDWTGDPMALAITSVFVDTSTGKIKDADIEVNANNFSWADLVADPSLADSSQDLQNALTHEMGHMIGLDHTCYVPGSVTTPPLDNSGQPIPDCDDASEAVRDTTMSAVAIRGDTGKRTLAPDDIAGVCDIYPVAMDPMSCPTEDVAPPTMEACRCDAGGVHGPSTGLAAGLLALAALVRRRRVPRR